MSKLGDRWRYSATNTRFWNWRNQRTLTRGKRDIPARIGDQVRSRVPVLRNRINRGTGRPHRDDRDMGRLSDKSLARTKARLKAPSRQEPGRAAGNQQYVRDTLAARQPQYAKTVERAAERAVRDLSPRRGRSR